MVLVTFDKLLEDLLPHFEAACGKRLYPTYSYARLYKPGEELKNILIDLLVKYQQQLL
jgi:hypothetical protein